MTSFYDWEHRNDKKNVQKPESEEVETELPFIEIIPAWKIRKTSNNLRSHNMIRFNPQTFRLNDHNHKRLISMCGAIMETLLYIRPNTFQDDVEKMVAHVFDTRKSTRDDMNFKLGRG